MIPYKSQWKSVPSTVAPSLHPCKETAVTVKHGETTEAPSFLRSPSIPCIFQWSFQEPRTIGGTDSRYFGPIDFSGLNFGEYPQKIWPNSLWYLWLMSYFSWEDLTWPAKWLLAFDHRQHVQLEMPWSYPTKYGRPIHGSWVISNHVI